MASNIALLLICSLSEFLPIVVISTSPMKVRVITWNVADNSQMVGSFTDEAIDNVLGLKIVKKGNMPSLYAIGLEENCWMCNHDNWPKIGDRFLERINRKALSKYTVVGIQGTRVGSSCEIGCKLNSHGSALLILIAQISLGTQHLSFRHNKGCSSTFIANKEKGVAAMKFMDKKSGRSLCFGVAHLDSAKSKYRRDCLKRFFATAEEEISWTSSCDFEFIFGDFNTRTEDGSKKKGFEYLPKTTNFTDLKAKDELTGNTPYGKDSEWKGNLLSFVNFVQTKQFVEQAIDFMPTYSVKAGSFCYGKSPCYRTDRPKSWTDRIIYTNGICEEYDAIYEEYGDHFPVFAEFKLQP